MSEVHRSYSTPVTPFQFESSSVRTVMRDGEPWFVGRDVCRALGLENESQALGRLDEDERKGVCISDPLGKNQQTAIAVSEAGVYRLIFTSRVPKAEAFKRWLAHEVLPSIRRTGGYGQPIEQPMPGVARSRGRPRIAEPLPDAILRVVRELGGSARQRDVHRKLQHRANSSEIANAIMHLVDKSAISYTPPINRLTGGQTPAVVSIPGVRAIAHPASKPIPAAPRTTHRECDPLPALHIMESAIVDAMMASHGAPEAFPQALHTALWNRIDELEGS